MTTLLIMFDFDANKTHRPQPDAPDSSPRLHKKPLLSNGVSKHQHTDTTAFLHYAYANDHTSNNVIN